MRVRATLIGAALLAEAVIPGIAHAQTARDGPPSPFTGGQVWHSAQPGTNSSGVAYGCLTNFQVTARDDDGTDLTGRIRNAIAIPVTTASGATNLVVVPTRLIVPDRTARDLARRYGRTFEPIPRSRYSLETTDTLQETVSYAQAVTEGTAIFQLSAYKDSNGMVYPDTAQSGGRAMYPADLSVIAERLGARLYVQAQRRMGPNNIYQMPALHYCGQTPL